MANIFIKSIEKLSMHISIIQIFFGFIFLSTAYGSDFQSPRTTALGGAGHASPLLSDAIFLNPSYSPFIKTHSLSMNYMKYGGGTFDTPDGLRDYYGHILNLSVLDGTSESLFQAGVGYTRREDVTLIHVGAAKTAFKNLSIGLGSKFVLPNDGNSDRLVDATFSISGLLTSWFQSALIIDNILEAAKNRGFFREFILGTKFNINSITLIYFDPHWISNASTGNSLFGVEAGIEFPFMDELFLRMGYFKNSVIPHEGQTLGDGYGIGLGWIGPKLSLDYSYSRVTTGIMVYAHNFGFTVFF